LQDDDWQQLTEEQQEDFVREMVAVRNILKATKERYFEF